MSLLRILYGIAMFSHLVTSARDRHYLWGVASAWVEGEAAVRGWPELLRELFSKEDSFYFDVAYGVTTLLAALFVLGYRTRIVTPILAILWVALSTNSIVLTNGGDALLRITLVFLVFANLSEHWSVDSWLRSRRGFRTRRRWHVPREIASGAHNAALLLCCYQVLLVYVSSGIYKLMGEEWRSGTAVYYAMNLDVFMPFPALSELVWQSSVVVAVATWTAIWIQLLSPIALLWWPSRYVVLLLLLGMHLGIGLLLGLWPFSLVMIGMDMLFTHDRSWERVLDWTRERLRSLRPVRA